MRARGGGGGGSDSQPIPADDGPADRLFPCVRQAGQPELERLLTFCHISGMPDQMAAKAMEIAAGNGPKNAIGYTLTILNDWKEHHVFQPHQIGEYQVERDRRENRGMLWGSGDVLEDYRAEQEARERRLRENIDEGLEEGAAQ